MTNAATAPSTSIFANGIHDFLQSVAREQGGVFFGRAAKWNGSVVLPIIREGYPYNRRYLTSGEARPNASDRSCILHDRFNLGNKSNAVVLMPAGTLFFERAVKRDAILYPNSTAAAWLFTKAEKPPEPPRFYFYENQVGCAEVHGGRVIGFEIFDYPVSFEAMQYSSFEIGLGAPEADAAERKAALLAVRTVLSMPLKFFPHWEHRPKNGEAQSRVLSIVSQQLDGSATELDKSLIHLYLYTPRP
jgi:hypothetical protein